jgi:hypothetical protein
VLAVRFRSEGRCRSVKKLWWSSPSSLLRPGSVGSITLVPWHGPTRLSRKPNSGALTAATSASGIEGQIVDVVYRLESAERQDDGSVRLVVVRRSISVLGVGTVRNRRIAQTRQHVEIDRSTVDG